MEKQGGKMTGPFKPTPGGVITNDPTTVWRATNAIIQADWPSEMRTYFMTHQVVSWIHQNRAREEYAALYGNGALYMADAAGVCEENVTADQVAGTIQGDVPERGKDSAVVVGATRKAYTGPAATVESVKEDTETLRAIVNGLETRVTKLEQ
jgi:hypothetical protein